MAAPPVPFEDFTVSVLPQEDLFAGLWNDVQMQGSPEHPSADDPIEVVLSSVGWVDGQEAFSTQMQSEPIIDKLAMETTESSKVPRKRAHPTSSCKSDLILLSEELKSLQISLFLVASNVRLQCDYFFLHILTHAARKSSPPVPSSPESDSSVSTTSGVLDHSLDPKELKRQKR